MGRPAPGFCLPSRVMSQLPARNDFDGWVRQLARPQRHRLAKQHLMQSGAAAIPAVCRGLQRGEPRVRRSCVNILDHIVDVDSLPVLAAAVDDEDPIVAGRALHALACDVCKQDQCGPREHLYVPRALELLSHPDADLRAAAIDALGKVARRREDVHRALAEHVARERDVGLRGKARRFVDQCPPSPDSTPSPPLPLPKVK